MDEAGTGGGSPESAPTRSHRGANQSGIRDHNERVVLSLVRLHGSLSKSEIARMANLSAQTSSVIMRQLETDGLLSRGEPQRGKIGQPSIPMSLNPGGALFLGLKIGRRSAEVVMIDFLGQVRGMRHHAYRYPTPADTVAFAIDAIASLRAPLSGEHDRRIAGLGIAMPFELWNWAEHIGASSADMEGWRSRDIRAELQQQFSFPVYVQNDASSACGAELVFGQIGAPRDFIYFYIGAFAGGGVVLDGRLHVGPTGNAGALGSMPVPGPDGRPVQLIDIASLAVLERHIRATGADASYLWTSPEDWDGHEPDCRAWVAQAGRALAYAIVSASAVLDFAAAIIDGWMPAHIRAALVAATATSLAEIDVEGLQLPAIREGTVGIHARAIGAASLPLSERFLVGPATLT
ncbi:MAG TPA: ROK family transcriptional regulator [Mesorhizobium sp.]